MDASALVSSTAEFALDQLEKRGVLVPFCKAVSEDASVIFYTPETNDPEDVSFRKAEDHQRKTVLHEVSQRKLVGLAFCKEVTLTMSEPDEVLPAIRVELHHIKSKSLVYLFPFKMTDGKAATLPYYTRDVEPVSLWSRTGIDRQRMPNQSPQRNAGSCPSSSDSPASETPSSLGPRG